MDKTKKKGTGTHAVRNSVQLSIAVMIYLAKAKIKADREKRAKLAAVLRKCERMIEDALEEESTAAEAAPPSA